MSLPRNLQKFPTASRSPDLQIPRSADPQIPRCPDLQISRFPEIQISRSTTRIPPEYSLLYFLGLHQNHAFNGFVRVVRLPGGSRGRLRERITEENRGGNERNSHRRKLAVATESPKISKVDNVTRSNMNTQNAS